MKRTLAIIMALALVLGSIPALAAEAHTFPLTEDPITLTVFTYNVSHMSDPETNRMNQLYEEMTGVKIDWILSQEFATDLNLLIASGDYPDMILGDLSTAQLLTMQEAGMVIALNDLIESDGFYTSQVFAERPDFLEQLTAPDGNVYSLFSTDVGVHMPNRRKMFVKSDWLAAYKEAEGVQTPATTEEFEAMLTYFRDADINGNGVADEIPLIASTNAEDDAIYYLMSAFTQISNNFYHIDEDGGIVFEAASEEWREGLRWINHLYEEGLFLAEESYVQDRDQLRSLVNVSDASQYVVGSIPTFWEGRFVDTSVLNYTDFEPIAPIAGPEGVLGATITATETFRPQCAITTACEYPEIAMQWLDWWVSEEGSFAHAWGMEEGVDYEWVDLPSFLGDDKSVMASEDSYSGNFRFGENSIPKMDRPEIRYAATDDPSSYNTNNTYVLYRAGTMYEPYYVPSNVPQVIWNADEALSSELNEVQMLISDEVRIAYTEFILGIRDLDSDWDAYLATLETLGLSHYIDLLGQLYSK